MNLSVIIPAYNEEKHIAGVLRPLIGSRQIYEVICVNDASTDNTLEIMRSFDGIRVLSLPVNGGKAAAIVEGIAAASGDIIVMIDADLQGMTDRYVIQMATPLHSGQCEAVLGHPSGLLMFGPLTGERAYFRKDLLPHLDTLKQTSYGLELALNYLFKDKKIYNVALYDVRQLGKPSKYPLPTAIKRDLDMWGQLGSFVLSHDRPFAFIYGAFLKHYYIRPPNPIIKLTSRQLIRPTNKRSHISSGKSTHYELP